MPLIRKQGASTPKELGLFWPMQTSDGMNRTGFAGDPNS